MDTISKQEVDILAEEYVASYNAGTLHGRDLGELKRNGETRLIRAAAYMAYMTIIIKEANESCYKMQEDSFLQRLWRRDLLPVEVGIIACAIAICVMVFAQCR